MKVTRLYWLRKLAKIGTLKVIICSKNHRFYVRDCKGYLEGLLQQPSDMVTPTGQVPSREGIWKRTRKDKNKDQKILGIDLGKLFGIGIVCLCASACVHVNYVFPSACWRMFSQPSLEFGWIGTDYIRYHWGYLLKVPGTHMDPFSIYKIKKVSETAVGNALCKLCSTQ